MVLLGTGQEAMLPLPKMLSIWSFNIITLLTKFDIKFYNFEESWKCCR